MPNTTAPAAETLQPTIEERRDSLVSERDAVSTAVRRLRLQIQSWERDVKQGVARHAELQAEIDALVVA